MILRRHFLHQSTPTVYLLNKMKQCEIWFLFSEDTVFIFINSAVCWTLRSLTPWLARHRRVSHLQLAGPPWILTPQYGVPGRFDPAVQ